LSFRQVETTMRAEGRKRNRRALPHAKRLVHDFDMLMEYNAGLKISVITRGGRHGPAHSNLIQQNLVHFVRLNPQIPHRDRRTAMIESLGKDLESNTESCPLGIAEGLPQRV